MVFSEENKALIKNLYLIKGYRPRRLMSEFPGKGWKRSGMCKLLARLHKMRAAKRKHGNGTTGIVCNEWRDQHKACVVRKMDILKTKCDDANCDQQSLGLLKVLINFISVKISGVINCIC